MASYCSFVENGFEASQYIKHRFSTGISSDEFVQISEHQINLVNEIKEWPLASRSATSSLVVCEENIVYPIANHSTGQLLQMFWIEESLACERTDWRNDTAFS